MRRARSAGVLGCLFVLAGVTVIADSGGGSAYAKQVGAEAPPCARPTGPPSLVTPTTIGSLARSLPQTLNWGRPMEPGIRRLKSVGPDGLCRTNARKARSTTK